MKVFIWGSCVSRDCFNYPSSSSLELVKYHARCSCVSAMSKPFSLTGINIDAIANKFKRQAVIDDFQKQLLPDLETTEFDILLIDFIDERFALKIDDEGRVVTVSAELQETGSVALDDSLVYVGDEKRFSLLHEAWNKFMEFCDRHGIRDKIVLNCVRWADHMENGEPVSQFTQNYIARHNAFLERIYEVVKKDIPESRHICYSDELLVANSKHRWGISPFHYIDNLYNYTNKQLMEISSQYTNAVRPNEKISSNDTSGKLGKSYILSDFKYKQYIVKDVLILEINDKNTDETKYGYYLKKNNDIIKRISYSEKKTISFQLDEDGDYQIIIFIKTNNENPYIISAKKVFHHTTYAILYGSTTFINLCMNYSIKNNNNAEFAIIDLLDDALSWYREIFSNNEKKDFVVQKMRLATISKIAFLKNIPSYMIRWNFCTKYSYLHKLQWILEELYDICRRYITTLHEKTIRTTLTDYQITNLELDIHEKNKENIITVLSNICYTEHYNNLEQMKVDICLKDDQLTAMIHYNNKCCEDKYSFYLIKDGKVIDRTGWIIENKFNWTLNNSGIYVVFGFIMKSDYKVIRKSVPCSYHTNDLNSEFGQFLSSTDDKKFFNKKVPFYNAKAPFCDILVISSKGNKDYYKSVQHVKLVDSIDINDWHTHIFSNHSYSMLRDKKFLLSGIGVFENLICEGMENLPNQLTFSDIFDQKGSYTAILWDNEHLIVGTDLFAGKRWFYYKDNDLLVITNSYHLLLLTLKYIGIYLDLDDKKAALTLCSVRFQMLAQNFCRKMDIQKLYQMTADTRLELNNNGWQWFDSGLGTILSSQPVYHQDDYLTSLDTAKDELIENCELVLQQNSEDVIVDLSGGLDTRMVYSAMTCTALSHNKIRIFSQDTPGNSDLKVALSINSLYNYSFDTSCYSIFFLNLKKSNEICRSFYMGTYFCYSILTSKKIDHRMKCIGAYGEVLARPYVSRKYLNTYIDSIKSTDDFVLELYKDHADVIAVGNSTIPNIACEYLGEELDSQKTDTLLESLEAIYTMFRHGYHFDSIACRLGERWAMPLQSKTMLKLRHMSFNVHKSIKLQLDMLYKLNPLVASIPFESDNDNKAVEELQEDLDIEHYCRHACIKPEFKFDDWKISKDICEKNITRQNNPDPNMKYLNEIMYNELMQNFKNLMLFRPKLCEIVGVDLYRHFKLIKGQYMQIYHWYNKITSLLDQHNIMNNNYII